MQDELALLSRARAFEQEALTTVHDRYYDAVYRYVSFRISDPQTVEDLTSEVFIRFLSALSEKNAPQNTIRGWLFGTASRVVKEQYRRQKRTSMAQLDETTPDKKTNVERDVEFEFEKEALRQALTELTEDQQHVLALRYGHGMPIRETAETMNKSEGSVKMLQVRAIAALSRYMSRSEKGL